MLEVKPNLLDRLIAYVSPGTAARRMHARYCMAAAGGLVAGVRRIAGGHDGTLANWNPRRDQRLSESLGFDKAMLRAESLACNDGHAASCVDALALNVAGPGLRPQSYPDAATLGITEEQAADFAESVPVVCGSRRRRDAALRRSAISGRPQHVRDRRIPAPDALE